MRDYPGKLEIEYPSGDPGAIRCRGCKGGRRIMSGVLICPTCDLIEPLPAPA